MYILTFKSAVQTVSVFQTVVAYLSLYLALLVLPVFYC